MKFIPIKYRFNRLPIVPCTKQANGFVVKKGEQEIASFSFDSIGCISDLWVNRNFRRKSTGLDAIFSIREFIINKAKEQNLDYVEFHTQGTKKRFLDYFKFWSNPKKNKQLEKLYRHLGAEMLEYNSKGSRFIGIINPKNREEILESINLQESTFSPSTFLEILKDLVS